MPDAYDLAKHDDIASRRLEIASTVRARLRAHRPELAALLSISRDIVSNPVPDLGHDVLQLAAAMGAGLPELFADHVGWLRRTFLARGGTSADLNAYVDELGRAVMSCAPSRSSSGAAACLAAGLDSLRAPVAPEPSHLAGDGVPALGAEYLRALLEGRRRDALNAVLAAADDGLPAERLLLDVFQPVQREVGRLWQCGTISVAQEHSCTAVTQQAISMLYPRMFSGLRHRRRLVSAAVPGNLHELGARMVADCFELAGWDTMHLGADTPVPDLAELVAARKPEVLALSASMIRDIPAAVRVIRAIRADSSCAGVTILAGGAPFAVAPDLGRRCGADAVATDGREAVLVGEGACGVAS